MKVKGLEFNEWDVEGKFTIYYGRTGNWGRLLVVLQASTVVVFQILGKVYSCLVFDLWLAFERPP